MKTGGRPRTATAILNAKGSFEKNPDRKRTAEPLAEGEAVRPSFVRGRAKRIWDRYAPLVAQMDLLKAVDAHNFGVWCCLAAEFEEGPGRMTAARISQMRQAGERFGLDPGARARLSVGKQKPEKDPAEKYFGKITTGSGNALRQ